MISINYLFESKINVKYIYHFLSGTDISTVKKYGLCSPSKLLQVDPELFNQTTFDIYKERASNFLKIPIFKLTSQDILKYLDTSSKFRTSKSIFFSLCPIKDYNIEFYKRFTPCFQIEININKLLKYKPILYMYKDIKYISWNYLTDDFIDIVKSTCEQPIKTKLLFLNIPHLCLDIEYIPYNDFDNIIEYK